MASDTPGVERALGAIGTTFRLARLYPPTHPAVAEALRQVSLVLGRRTQRLSSATPALGGAAIDLAAPPPLPIPSPATGGRTVGLPPASRGGDAATRRATAAFRPDVVPVDVQVKRAITALKAADG